MTALTNDSAVQLRFRFDHTGLDRFRNLSCAQGGLGERLQEHSPRHASKAGERLRRLISQERLQGRIRAAYQPGARVRRLLLGGRRRWRDDFNERLSRSIGR